MKSILASMLLLTSVSTMAQTIDIIAQYGSYEPAQFAGYGNKPEAEGLFYSSAGKTSGVIPAYTAQLTITLAPEVPWTGEPFTIPAGWIMDPTSTPDNLTFYNSEDWTTEDPYFEIPVRAIAARSTTAFSVGTQVMNIGGDWVDDLTNNQVNSAVTVADVPLPVTLVSFNAAKEGSVAHLTWATTAETNSDRFEIQRSLDGKSWGNIGSVDSYGESHMLREYQFTDKTPLIGANLYRLRMVDKDETFAFSSIKSVRFDHGVNSEIAVVYPNPSTDKVYVNSPDFATIKQISIVDMNGRAVYTTKAVASGIDVKALSSGAYLLKVSNYDGSTSVHKFLISR